MHNWTLGAYRDGLILRTSFGKHEKTFFPQQNGSKCMRIEPKHPTWKQNPECALRTKARMKLQVSP